MNIQTLDVDLLIDYKKSYFETVSALVLSPPLPNDECKRLLERIREQGGVIFVVYDKDTDMLVGTGTVYTQQKLSRGGAKSAHIEEICVHPDHQGKGIGTVLMHHAIQVSRELGCYKALLNCEEEVVTRYEKFGFEKKEVEMKMYL